MDCLLLVMRVRLIVAAAIVCTSSGCLLSPQIRGTSSESAPPVIAPEKANFDVPVHVFSRDSNLLDEFRERGFGEGLALGRTDAPALEHGGFFSLIVRALVRCCGAGTTPPYLRTGVPMGA